MKMKIRCEQPPLTICDNEIFPFGFSIYRKDRGSRGGGVMVAIKHSLSSFLISSPPDHEVVTLAIQTTNLLTLCVVSYSPTASDDYKTFLIKYLYSRSFSTDLCIIMGDFNSPDIDWPSLTGWLLSYSNALCNLVFDTNHCPLINVPTQIKGNILDLVSSTEGVVKDLNIGPSYVHTFPTDIFSHLFFY